MNSMTKRRGVINQTLDDDDDNEDDVILTANRLVRCWQRVYAISAETSNSWTNIFHPRGVFFFFSLSCELCLCLHGNNNAMVSKDDCSLTDIQMIL